MSVATIAPATTRRAALYCRVSSTQQEEDGTSLGTQEARCRQYAAGLGYLVDECHVYREVYSGAEFRGRRMLVDLRAEVRSGQVDVVVAYAVDRLSRNQAHLYILLEEIEHAGARVEFVTETLENTAVGKFLLSARAFAAELEREKFQERSRRGKEARVAAGKLMHGKAPLYGYSWTDSDKGRLVENPETAPVVRRMFRECLDGTPLRSIAAGLTKHQIPAPRGGPIWDFVVVSKILRNPAYTGAAYAFRCRYERVPGSPQAKRIPLPPAEWTPLPEGTIPPLVDEAVFAAAQYRLDLNRRQSPRRTFEPEAYLLRGGYVRCGYCGNSMTVHRKSRSTAYECTRGSRSTGMCTQHGISTRVLDAVTWVRVRDVLLKPEIIEAELKRVSEDDPTEADLAAVDRALAELVRRQSNLSRSLAMFDDSEAAAPVVAELEALVKRQRNLEAERTQIASRRGAWAAARERLADVQSWCRSVAVRLGELTYQQRRTALEALGVQVTVWKADHNPRYVITAKIPLCGPGGGFSYDQAGQDSMLYVASQKASS